MANFCMKVNYFNTRKEEGQNPYIGFTSFQHFRDEALYSDLIVRPENNLTETEHVECYPIPEDVLQNGREEGFYPDSTMAYYRVLWKDFEPEQGKYNYALIEKLLEQAKEHEQLLIFRLLPHSTRARDDVPDWLKALIPCPERPDGARVKDSPTDPLFLKLFENAIRKIGERFDDNPVLYAVDICLPGAWGEGHNLHLYSEESLIELADTFLEAFPKTSLVAQISKPWLVKYVNEKRPIGWRGDGCGSPKHLNEIYPRLIQEMPDIWKKAPISFEAYWWIGEWKRQGWDIDAIIEKTLSWHISLFNAKSLPIPEEWREKVEYWISRMGYHFAPDYFKSPECAQAGKLVEFELCMENCGVAPIYESIPFMVRLANETSEYVFDTDIDIRKWLPGKHVSTISIPLPENMVAGKYDVEIGILGEDTPMIYLCTDAVRNGRYYKMGDLIVESYDK